MAAQKRYPDELRERAVKMVLEIRERDGKGHGEIARVARQLDVHPEVDRPGKSGGRYAMPFRRACSGWSVVDAGA